jgi:RNA polymerase sigma factor (sigma-70 family)
MSLAPDVPSLVRAATDGDQEAWNALVDTFAGLVWSVVRSHNIYGAEAADISQTVWLRCVEHIGRLREPERLGAWLATTAKHECYRVLRRSGRQVVMADVPDAGDAATTELPQRRLEQAEDQAALVAALDRVPQRCQQLLRLMLTDPPLAYDDIAELLDMPKGSIGPTRMRCMAHVRLALAGGGYHGASA